MVTVMYFYQHVSYPTNERAITLKTVANAFVQSLRQGTNFTVSGKSNVNNKINVVTGNIDKSQTSINPQQINDATVNISQVVDSVLVPLDDFIKYPCVPNIPFFPNSRWSVTGKCVRMFNDTKKANELKAECVSLRTKTGTTPICIYDPVKDKYISQSLKTSGQWEGDLVNNILEALKKHPDTEFLDLGCNIGTYSLAAAHLGRKVIAVDAVIENLELLSKSLILGNIHHKAVLIWNAISDEYLKVSLTKYQGNVGGTAIRNLTKEDISNKDKFITQTIMLDDLVPLLKGKRVVIKMDIETQEYHAMQGGKNFFDTVDIEMIQMEINWHKTRESGPKIVEFLAKRNFKVFADYSGQRPLNVSTIQTWPGDVYFVKSAT